MRSTGAFVLAIVIGGVGFGVAGCTSSDNGGVIVPPPSATTTVGAATTSTVPVTHPTIGTLPSS